MSERQAGSSDTIGTTGLASETPRTPAELAIAETLPASAAAGSIATGQRVGRFTISHLLGAGGMGQVYAARDPELDRLVAIKLLRPELSLRADARLRREARAMARLSHPHLVTVHEVGFHEGQLFVAMELIDGRTLRHWARGKSWRELVRVYVAAGRGLAAAHEAGIVHRDFKPDNVLVGNDGRVAVSDFGLARTEEDDLPADATTVAADDRLTQAGALLGTLRYMAPEQLERRIADARSDQFAFCVSLWEALDDHPFDNLATASEPTSADARRDAMGTGLARRRLRGVPRQISRALIRGLAIDPASRWAAMPALIDELESAVARRGKLVIAGTMFGLVGVAITATWFLREPQANPCDHVTDPLAVIWYPGAAALLTNAFVATERPSARDAATRVAEALDRRAGQWATMRVETCVAARADGDQLAELHGRQVRCLDAKLHELDAVVGTLLTRPSGEVVDRSIRVISGLAPIAECGNVDQLLSTPKPPPEPLIEARIDRLVAKVERFRARDTLVGMPEGELVELEIEAALLRWDPLIARVAYIGAVNAYRRGDTQAAEAKFRQAALVAARAHEDTLVGEASAYAAEAMLDSDHATEALAVAQAAEVASARAGDPPGLKADVLTSLADVYAALGRYDDSDHAYQQATELLQLYDANPIDLANLMANWANSLYERSDFARSVPLSNRAVEMLRHLLGDHNPDLARALTSNGNEQLAIHDYALALARHQESLAIKRANFGDHDSTVAMTYNNIGTVYDSSHQYVLAAENYQRALDIWLPTLGDDHAYVLMARYNLAINLRHQGKVKQAVAALEAVLAQRRAARHPAMSKVANTLDALASAHLELGDRPRAIDLAEQALALREQALGPETADVGESLSRLAQLYADAGNCAKARPDGERALAIAVKQKNQTGASLAALAACDAHDGKRADALAGYRRAIAELVKEADDPDTRGTVRLAFADLLWSTDRAGARAQATAAVADLGTAAERANAWLAAHR